MANDDPQKWIEAQKRKLQPQAFDPFMAEMKAAEASGDLPPATVYVGPSGPEIISDPAGGGHTPSEAMKTLEGRRRKSWLATERAYQPDYIEGRSAGEPSWLVKGLREVGLLGLDEDISDHYGDNNWFTSMNNLEKVGFGELRHKDPKKQVAALALWQRFKNDPAYDYYGYESGAELERVEEEFPRGDYYHPYTQKK